MSAPLISLHLASSRPHALFGLVCSLEATASTPSAYELVAAVYEDDNETRDVVAEVSHTRQTQLKVQLVPRRLGWAGLWRAYDTLFDLADPRAYFIWQVNDEMRFGTPQWDLVLARYVRCFPDDLFRLRVGSRCLAQYASLSEACEHGDIPIATRRWVEIAGRWSEEASPGVIHGATGFYLGRFGVHRDVPALDFEVTGTDGGVNVPAAFAVADPRRAHLVFDRGLRHGLRTSYARRARRLEAAIRAHTLGVKQFRLEDLSTVQAIELVREAPREVLARLSYRLSRLRSSWENFVRIVARSAPDSLYGRSVFTVFCLEGCIAGARVAWHAKRKAARLRSSVAEFVEHWRGFPARGRDPRRPVHAGAIRVATEALRRADAAGRARRLPLAVRGLRLAAALRPWVGIELAAALCNAGRHEEALAAVRRALTVVPGDHVGEPLRASLEVIVCAKDEPVRRGLALATGRSGQLSEAESFGFAEAVSHAIAQPAMMTELSPVARAGLVRIAAVFWSSARERTWLREALERACPELGTIGGET